jgi:hypothetical protein
MRQTLGELMLCDNRYKILPALRASLLGIFHHVLVIFYICFPVMPGFVHSSYGIQHSRIYRRPRTGF